MMSFAVRRRRCQSSPARCGFTLMETMIAIGLMTLLMAGLYSAMTMYLNLRTDSHEEIERLQIARTLLRQISRDVQSVVFEEQKTTDESMVDDVDMADDAADPAAAMSFYTNGLVGTETDLLLYISRPDRDLNYVSSQSLKEFSDRSGDLMIVRYFVAEKGSGGIASDIFDYENPGARSGSAGLVRMTGDLYGLSMAINENEDQSQISAAKVVAREVSEVRFQYFDGVQWKSEWDSTALNLLPQAVEVTLTLQSESPQSGSLLASESRESPYAIGQTSHRMVINLPIATPFVSETSL